MRSMTTCVIAVLTNAFLCTAAAIGDSITPGGGDAARSGVSTYIWLEGESPDILLEAGDYLQHVHFSTAPGRTYPHAAEEGFAPFFAALHAIGYHGRISIEAQTSSLDVDGPAALAVLRGFGG